MASKVEVVSALVEHFPYAGLFTLLILGGIGLPFPEDATLILCGFLISQGVVKPVHAVIVVYAGLLLADFFLYSVGKKYGRMIVTHKRFHRILPPERLSKFEEQFNKRGSLVILFGRHFFGLRAQLFITAGVMRMPPLKFLAADAFTSILTMALMIGAGYMGGNSLDVLKKDISRIEHIVIMLAIVLLVGYLFYRFFKQGNNKKVQK
ncbi:MAG: DedA family protein [Nitrospirae bacterium]|nr:DedA family protein [Nitrospirota bacterium]